MNTETQHPGHVTPIRVYMTVALALLLLTAVTVKVSTIHLGAWNAVVALAIASVKGILVALFFMHLLYDKKIYMFVVSVALIVLSIFIALTMADILGRGDIYDNQASPIKQEARIYSSDKSDSSSIIQGQGQADTTEAAPGH